MTDNAPIKAPFGVVDMGSNGIRFGIVSALARHLPVAYEERAPIALLDAQGDDCVIPDDVIDQVITSFLRFKKLCQDAKVEPNDIRVIATEATRIAANSKEFLHKIYQATGWRVSLLSKQEEALISASGIVGSFNHVNGLTMDLGGGSVEISYVMTSAYLDSNNNDDDSNSLIKDSIRVSTHPVSLPYGAAALKRRLAKCESKDEMNDLYNELVAKLKKAHDEAKLPKTLLHKDGYKVYMSGGGFRAIGYLSMAINAQDKIIPRRSTKRKHMYPIPIINGYSITGRELKDLVKHYRYRNPRELMKKLKVFRISKRRAGMIPASCFLLSAILEVFKVKRVYFSEGGVRQGFCYQLLPLEEKIKDPFLEGVKAYAAQSAFALSQAEFDAIYAILVNALPELYLDPMHPLQLYRLLPAAIHLSNITSHYPKETRAFVAFHMPLAGGPLANVPGLSHRERAILSILLAFRQGGSVPDPIFYAVQAFIGRKGISVCKYVGRLMELVFAVSPLHPGIGLIDSGLSFTTIIHNHNCTTDSEDENSNNSSSSSSSSDCSSSDSDSVYEDNDSEFEDNDATNYPSMQLRITLPERFSPLVDAPAVMSVIESLDKKVNTKKFDMDEERRPLKCPNLFSVEVIRK
ncbi:Ppx/GppA phosphatase family-domain-containing protein [Cokeromyces recurvatus]|uniref:Ppx/GppA phosphatase family-domain-containing protein n=1 Tax=Cokeromyces recurvatus TaxID=90255 RepID=UPI00222091C8|nr:Ppx/GppA phosphatase family-domain-containing protein [Cokeromyces recurvatus]KAI7907943.1 Ppx/GppA phosphatase family-domain-containing protein [Cokeromyces recurvatus]